MTPTALPDTIVTALAEAVSLAVRIEAQLLRKMRLELFPGAAADVEADLWFSQLVESRAPTGIVLRPAAADLLRRRLAEKPAQLDAAWRVVESLHRGISPAVFAEERLAYLALSGKYDEMRALLRTVVATLISPRGAGLAGWAGRAIGRLPDAARTSEEAQMLAFGASLRLGESEALASIAEPTRLAEWAGWLAPGDLDTVAFGVALLEDAVEFGPVGRPRSHRIDLPRTTPLFVELAWQDGDHERTARPVLSPHNLTIVEIGPGVTEVDIRTVLGDTYWLTVPAPRRESLQKKLARVRPPRVRITYDVEVGGAIEKKEIPFVVGVLADLSGEPEPPLPPLRYRSFLEIDSDNFDTVLATSGARLSFNVENRLSDAEDQRSIRVDLRFSRMADFEPAHVAEQVGALHQLLGFRMALAEQVQSGKAEGDGSVSARIAELDEVLSARVREILHHPSFQALEATWRGLHYLVTQTEISSSLKIKVWNVSKQELAIDFGEASGWEESRAFAKVYEEFDVFGREPFGLLVGAFEFSHSEEDVNLMEGIARVAAANHSPFLAAAGANMFHLDSFASLGHVTDIGKFFDSPEFGAWNSLRNSEGARYVGLTLPRMLLRLPYGKDIVPVQEFSFEEGVNGSDHERYLWGNAAFALAARITQAFSLYGWFSAIRGVEGGGLVEGLPTHAFTTGDGDVAVKSPTEVAIMDLTEAELSRAGFIPLCSMKGTDNAVFFSVASAQKPAEYNSPDASGNARLAGQLPSILAVSRFAQYLKCMIRDVVGSFMSRNDFERYLNNWIRNYVSSDENADQATKAKYPLAEARIDIEEVEGRPGAYRAIAYMRPRFQLEELTESLRVVVDLPSPNAAPTASVA